MWFCITNTFTYNNRLRITGAATNYSWSLSSTSSDSADFGTAGSFSASPASGALSGGANAFAGTTYTDYGTVTVVVDGSFTASACYGPNPAPACNGVNNSTAAVVAAALAGSRATGLNRPGSPVSVVPSGASLNFTYGTQGTVGNGVTVSYSSASAQTQWTFSPPSFSSNTPNVTLGGALNWGDLNANPLVTQYQYDSRGNLLCVEQHGNVTGTGCSAAASNDATSPWRVRRFTYDSFSRLQTATNPEAGTITYAYDADSNLISKTDARGITINYSPAELPIDELHRVRKKTYSNGDPAVTFVYDNAPEAKGKLVSLTDPAGSASYAYDQLGRLSGESRMIFGASNAQITNSLSYDYNLDGSLWKLHYPSGAVVAYTPDSAGRVLSAVDSGNNINYATAATYQADGQMTNFLSGQSATFAGITNTFSYNKRLQPINMSASAPSQTVFSIGYDFHLGNGNNGNVFGITNFKDNTRNQAFTYDPLNRLISAQNSGTDCNVLVLGGKKKFWGNNYAYDAWGNLLQKSVTKCSAENLNVTVGVNNRIGTAGYNYDAAGNMTANATDGVTATYDAESRIATALKSGVTTTYTYDSDGNRVKKTNGTNDTLYWYMTPGIVAESDLSGVTKSEYVFFAGERVARRDYPSGSIAYYFSDHLKTASVITDSLGNIKSESDFYPWGGELQLTNNDLNHYKFTGKERDTETGLDYFGARYYSNGLGRWVSADWSATPIPVPYADLGDPQSLDLNTYVRNIPTTKADVDGHGCGEMPCDLSPSIGEAIIRGLKHVDHALDVVADHLRSALFEPLPSNANPGNPYGYPRTCTCPSPQTQDKKENNNNSKSDNTSGEKGGSKDSRTSQDPLRRDKNGNPTPDPEAKGAAHTQLGTRTSKSQAGNPKYKQGMEFDANGKPVRRVDHTDHGRSTHPNPHEHQIDPNTGRVGPPKPLPPTPKPPPQR